MHYFIIISIILVIVIVQISIYCKTIGKIKIFKDVFADNSKKYCTRDEKEKSQLSDIKRATDTQLKSMLKTAVINVNQFIDTKTIYNTEGEPISVEQTFDSNRARRELGKRISVKESILTEHKNVVLDEILRSINNYLANNKGNVSDFHLMKDIVDRNCDSVEEEINTQIPVPLYLGLIGTMTGILVGIGYLWISGDLNALLSSSIA